MTNIDIHVYLDYIMANLDHIGDVNLDDMHYKMAEELIDRGYLIEDLIDKIKDIQ